MFDAVTLNGASPGPPTVSPPALEQKGAMTRARVGTAGVTQIELVHTEATRAEERPEVTNIQKMAELPVVGNSSVGFQTSATVEQRESVLPLTGSAGGAVDSQKDQMIKKLQGRVDELEEKLKNVLSNASSDRTLSEAALERPRSEHRQWSEWHRLEQQATPRLPASPARDEPDVF